MVIISDAFVEELGVEVEFLDTRVTLCTMECPGTLKL